MHNVINTIVSGINEITDDEIRAFDMLMVAVYGGTLADLSEYDGIKERLEEALLEMVGEE